jgi:hypothetical protein
MSDFRRRFDPSEFGSRGADATDLLGAARDLEAYADIGWTGPSATFEERVMAAIAVEPAPRLLGGPGFVATLRQAWRLAWSGGRPIAVRAQAIALVLLATVALAGAGSIAVVAASRFMTSQVEPPPTIQPSPSPSRSPSPSPSPSVQARACPPLRRRPSPLVRRPQRRTSRVAPTITAVAAPVAAMSAPAEADPAAIAQGLDPTARTARRQATTVIRGLTTLRSPRSADSPQMHLSAL